MALPIARDTTVQEANRQCQGTELYEWLVHKMPGPAWRCFAGQCSPDMRRLLFCTNHALQQLILANSPGLLLMLKLPAGYVLQLSQERLRSHASLLNVALQSPSVQLHVRPQNMRFIPWGALDEPSRVEASTLQQWCTFISDTIAASELCHVTSLGLQDMELDSLMPSYVQAALPGLHKLSLYNCEVTLPSDFASFASASGTNRTQQYTSLHTLELAGSCSIQRDDGIWEATAPDSAVSQPNQLPNLKHLVCSDAILQCEQWIQHLPLHQFTSFCINKGPASVALGRTCPILNRVSALIPSCTSLVHLRLPVSDLLSPGIIPFIRSCTCLQKLEISCESAIPAPAWAELVNTPWGRSNVPDITMYWPKGVGWWRMMSTMAVPQVGLAFPKVQLHVERRDLCDLIFPSQLTPTDFNKMAEAWQLQEQGTLRQFRAATHSTF